MTQVFERIPHDQRPNSSYQKESLQNLEVIGVFSLTKDSDPWLGDYFYIII
jgi:hypothetical protein